MSSTRSGARSPRVRRRRAPGRRRRLTANVSGGDAPLAYAWDTTNSGTFTPGGASVPASFATTGAHTVKVRITDAATVPHQQVLTLDVTVTNCRDAARLRDRRGDDERVSCAGRWLEPAGVHDKRPDQGQRDPVPGATIGQPFHDHAPGTRTSAGGEIALGSTRDQPRRQSRCSAGRRLEAAGRHPGGRQTGGAARRARGREAQGPRRGRVDRAPPRVDGERRPTTRRSG